MKKCIENWGYENNETWTTFHLCVSFSSVAVLLLLLQLRLFAWILFFLIVQMYKFRFLPPHFHIENKSDIYFYSKYSRSKQISTKKPWYKLNVDLNLFYFSLTLLLLHRVRSYVLWVTIVCVESRVKRRQSSVWERGKKKRNNKIERKSYNFVLTREMANLSGVWF